MSDTMVDVLLLTTPRPPWLAPGALNISENSGPPLGLLYIAQFLQQAGISVRVEDFYRFGQKPRDIVNLCRRWKPRLVGISSLTSGYHLAKNVCSHLKTTFPDIITVIGGIHASALPDQVAAENCFDFVVRGEGEETFRELCLAILNGKGIIRSFSDIKGIAFKVDQQVTLTSPRELLPIDDLPLPARELIPIHDYLQPGAILTSRGCTYRCAFCSSVTLPTHRYRVRQAKNVVAEMDILQEIYGVDEFEFIDDNFTGDKNRIYAFTRLLAGKRYHWGCQATIKDFLANPELLQKMVESGCAGLFFGIESGNNEVLIKIKGIETSQVISVIQMAIKLGLRHLVTSFILGLPWDNRQSIEDTIEFMLKLRDLGCHTPVAVLVPFPGSLIGKYPENYGIYIECKDYTKYYHNQALISTSHLSQQELKDLYFETLCRLTQEDLPVSGIDSQSSMHSL